jgi:hypothetical protein
VGFFMLCCSLVLLFLLQPLAPLMWIWRRFTGGRKRVNTAVAWSPSIAPRTAAGTSIGISTGKGGFLGGRRGRLILAIAGIELLVVAGATAAFFPPSADPRSQTATFVAGADYARRQADWGLDLHNNVWCRSFSASPAPADFATDPTVKEMRGDFNE